MVREDEKRWQELTPAERQERFIEIFKAWEGRKDVQTIARFCYMMTAYSPTKGRQPAK